MKCLSRFSLGRSDFSLSTFKGLPKTKGGIKKMTCNTISQKKTRPSEPSEGNSPGHGGSLPCGLPSLQWGWPSACSRTRGGDEACAMFMASSMFKNATLFFNTATRGTFEKCIYS